MALHSLLSYNYWSLDLDNPFRVKRLTDEHKELTEDKACGVVCDGEVGHRLQTCIQS